MAVLMRHKSNIYGLINDLTTLQNNINAEKTRATGVEGSLTSLSTTDKTTLVAAINEVLALLQTQASSLADDLAAEVARATAAEGVLTTDLTAESARAIAAEGVLTTNLSNEVTRATAAEGVLTTNLASETSRAIAAEGVLTTNLTAEVTRATTAEGVLTTNLTAEVTRATTIEGILATDLANETTNRISGDNALDGRLDIIEAHLVAGVFWKASFDTLAELEAAIDNEEVTEAGWAYYIKGDNDGYVVVPEDDGDFKPRTWSTKSLIKFADYTETSGLVSTERARAIAAEGALSIDLATEITRATGAEGVLTTDLAAEVTRATTAEGVLATDLATEKTRAQGAETALQSNIDAEAIRATTAEGVLTTNLTAEVTRATAAEGVLTTNLSNEVTRATAAEATKLAIASNLSDLADIAVARTNLDVYSKAETDDKIRLGGAIFVTETVSVASDKIVLTNAPKNGIVFNFATVRHVDANFVSYDIPVSVTATAGGKEFLLSADASGQFDGKSVIVQYAYVPVA